MAGQAASEERSAGGALWPGGVIAGIAFVFLLSYLITGTSYVLPILEDVAEARPYRWMVSEAFRHGRFPLWSPSYLAGFPLGGWAHASAFYPLGFIFSLEEDYAQAAVISLFLHLTLFGVGFFVLLRSLGQPSEAALLGALLITFGPILSYWQLSFLPTIFTSTWAPWLFAFAFRLLHRPRFREAAGIAAAFALQLTAGRYDLITRELVLLGVIALGLLFSRRHRWAVGVWLGGGIAGALLAAGAVLMHYEFVHHSIRSLPLSFKYWSSFQRESHILALAAFGVTFPSMLAALAGLRFHRRPGVLGGAVVITLLSLMWVWSPRWWSVFNYYLPVLKGLVWSNVMIVFFFLGMGVMMAEGISGWLRAGRIKTMAAVAVTASVLTLPFYLFWGWQAKSVEPTGGEIPLFLSFLARGRFWSALALFLSLPAVMLMVRRRVGGEGVSSRLIFFLLLLWVGMDVVGTGFLAAVRRPPYRFPEVPASLRATLPYQYLPWRSIHLFHFKDWWELDFPVQAGSEPYTRSFDGFISLPLRRYGEFLALLAPWALQVEDGRLKSERFMSAFKEDAFIAPTSMELMNFLNVGWFITARANIKFGSRYHFRWEPETSFDFRGQWQGVPAGEGWQQKGPAALGKELSLPPESRLAVRVEVLSSRVTVQVLMERDSDSKLKLLYSRVLEEKADRALEIPLPWLGEDVVKLRAGALPVREPTELVVVWHDPQVKSETQPLEWKGGAGDITAYWNPRALPLLFVVHEAVVLPEREERLSYLRAHPERLRREVVLESPLLRPLGPAPPGGEEVRVWEYNEQALKFEVQLRRPGIVVMSEAWYPGWKAETGSGDVLPLLCANHAFRALWLPEGRHRITLTFQPLSFRLGLRVSLPSLLCLLLVLARLGARRRGRGQK